MSHSAAGETVYMHFDLHLIGQPPQWFTTLLIYIIWYNMWKIIWNAEEAVNLNSLIIAEYYKQLRTADVFSSMMISPSLMFSSCLLNWRSAVLKQNSHRWDNNEPGIKRSCPAVPHLQPGKTWPPVTGRRLAPLPLDTPSSVPLSTSPGAWSRSARPGSV